jgi:alpha-galactosidase
MSAIRRAGGDAPAAWLLLTRRTAVLLRLGPDDGLYLPYWGANGGPDLLAEDSAGLPRSRRSEAGFQDGLPLAYPVYGSPSFKEPCLVVSRADGSRGPRLSFVEDRVIDDRLELDFRDDLLDLRLTQRFRVFPDLDLVAGSVIVRNAGSEPLTLERVLSGALPLPPGTYDALSLHGQWGREFQLQVRPLLPGKLVLDSRRGTSSAETHPWFAVRPRGEQAEDRGSVWFGSLAWSGNWVCVLEVERNDALSVVAGLQPFDFAWTLEPGEQFETPELVCGFCEDGLGGASRLLHAYEATVQLPDNHRERLRPVLYNSWEATLFAVNADQQIALARRAAELGVERFVVDDGWFGARDHDRAGLGDWTVNARKFPGGLRPLIDEVHRLGMDFGIWVEPEMVNPDSDLYRAHPDWAYHAEGRTPTLGRNQLVLNFARADVREAVLGQLRRLLSEHGQIDFVKWDHNRPWTWIDVGWPEQPRRQREAWVRHVVGLYEVLARLRAEFPRMMIEACASGGGRADLGILGWTDQVWTSDNTDAADRLFIQYGYSRAHSPRTMVCWVTDVPNQQTGRSAPLDFRFHVAMQGVLGIGGDISRWPAADLQRASELIAEYKAIRPVVQQGQQYWLLPPGRSGPCAVQYVSGDETVVFTFQTHGVLGQALPRLVLQGLDAERRYRRQSDSVALSGKALMTAGLPMRFASGSGLDYRSDLQVWRGA